MNLTTILVEVLLEGILTILPAWGWMLVALLGFAGLIAVLVIAQRVKPAIFGSWLIMAATFFGIRIFI